MRVIVSESGNVPGAGGATAGAVKVTEIVQLPLAATAVHGFGGTTAYAAAAAAFAPMGVIATAIASDSFVLLVNVTVFVSVLPAAT